jgi:hypothetical protein
MCQLLINLENVRQGSRFIKKSHLGGGTCGTSSTSGTCSSTTAKYVMTVGVENYGLSQMEQKSVPLSCMEPASVPLSCMEQKKFHRHVWTEKVFHSPVWTETVFHSIDHKSVNLE